MSVQANLFPIPERGRARRADADTAKEAARSVEVARLEGIVLEVLRDHPPGLTSFEIAHLTEIAVISISPRMRPLAQRGFIMDSGERRRTESGRRAIVWKVMP